jgi:hypothetical protein
MLTWLLLLSPFVAGYIIYRVYQKKNAEREAASSKRFDEIFGGAAKAPPPATPSPAFVPSEIRSAPVSVTHIPAAWTAKEKFLEPHGKLLYYLLKSGLPDHEVFAQVSVGAVVAAVQPGRKPVDGVIDFVVCDKQMKPVVAIRVSAANSLDAAGETVKAAGIRWVRIAPEALPQRGDIRTVVLGS